MTFILRRSSPYVLALFPFGANAHDRPTDGTFVEKPKTTSIERLKNIFYEDEFGNFSAELQYCIHLTSMGFIIGGFYGGIIRGKTAFVKFIDNNEATMFLNHMDAKRRLQDTMAYNVFKGVAQWGWRTALFTLIYGITSTSVAIIREKSGILEHTDGGFVAGAIYNIKNGIRGVIVGGGLGGVLGTIFGTITYVILLLSGKTMEDIRLYTREWKTEREELIGESDRKRRLKKDEEEIMKAADVLIEKEVS